MRTNSGQEGETGLPSWVPDGVDVTVPNVARVYDYLLGGYHNFAVDREYAEQLERAFPKMRQGAYLTRAWLGRTVQWLVNAGIRQFLDIGSGVPTFGNVHEIAERSAPGTRVMYVDIDPVAVAHAEAILAGNVRARVTKGDLHHPGDILSHPAVSGLLDFSKPVAVILSAVLHFIPDTENPIGIVAEFRDALAHGSYIVIAHSTQVAEDAEAQETVRQMSKRTATPWNLRSREQIAQLFTGLDVVEPGIVPITDWHPDPSEGPTEPWPSLLAAVGRKP